MNISDVYSKYKIPRHLSRHMLRVAVVGEWLAKQTESVTGTWEVVTVLLFHDVGNLLKFDLSQGIKLFDIEERDLDYWQKIKSDMSDRYGNDEHAMTLAVAREVGLSERVMFLLANMGSSNLGKTLKQQDMALKIVSYADFRVAPDGFVSVQERFADIRKRYKDSPHVLGDIVKTKSKRDQCIELEKQISRKLGVDLGVLPDKELEQRAKKLRNVEL